jgi:hypothetical protein
MLGKVYQQQLRVNAKRLAVKELQSFGSAKART